MSWEYMKKYINTEDFCWRKVQDKPQIFQIIKKDIMASISFIIQKKTHKKSFVGWEKIWWGITLLLGNCIDAY